MKFNNKIMLITYADSVGKDLKDLQTAIERYFSDAIGGIHILPFFPSSADRGFAPTDYTRVDPALGTFEDIAALQQKFYLMFDFMINHISSQSEFFTDFVKNKDKSPYRDLFLSFDRFWGDTPPSREELDKIYKRKPRDPFITVTYGDGTSERLWCTFSEEQIDLDVRSKKTQEFFRRTLSDMCERGAAIVRLDAFAYAVKKRGTNCFFVEPEIWELLDWVSDVVKPYGSIVLPEIHEHYSYHKKLAERGYWTYDFALPMLLLHALYFGNGTHLKQWFEICPRNQFTTLDTHDGIGIVDVVGLLSKDEITKTKENIFVKVKDVKKEYSTANYNNLDIYQINCTYYSALGENDQAYLLARAIQFFAPGIPQVYYVGMLAGRNDIELLEKTKQGRDINRHNYTLEELETETQRPVVQKLLKLMKFRNECPAFSGELECSLSEDGTCLTMTRSGGGVTAKLSANFKSYAFEISCPQMDFHFS